MSSPIYLIDKSAHELARRSEAVQTQILALGDRAATCQMIELEILYSARNAADYERLRRGQALRWLDTTSACLDRALEVQRELAERGQHRLPIPDLVIAATAEVHGAVVLHNDHDFETIAAVTGQAVERVQDTSHRR